MKAVDRRTFMKSAIATTGVTVLSAPYARTYAANATLRIAGIGVGGRGGAHVRSSLAEHLVAVCDASERATQNASERAVDDATKRGLRRTAPARFSDYRKMMDEMGSEIDAVFVATPDHHHYPASMTALKLKKHVYCEKPLTRDISESRRLAEAAREMKVATQLGNQHRAEEGWRSLCEYVWAGAIGEVKEVHVWTDRPGIPARPWWPQGGSRPAGEDPVPPGFHWNVWLGPAPMRPYLNTYKEGRFKGKRVYQPFVWRGWWDFGTGALGDIGCHALSGIYSALKIESADTVELVRDAGDGTREMFPTSCVIRWDIPARAGMPPCRLFWYDGGAYPSREIAEVPEGKPFPGGGSIVVGSRGKLSYSLSHPPRFLSGGGTDFKPPARTIPRCASSHFGEWVTAAKGGRAPFSNFVDHAGPLTEFVLLGNLAILAGTGRKVAWDGKAMRCTNIPALNALVRREPRKGWDV